MSFSVEATLSNANMTCLECYDCHDQAHSGALSILTQANRS